MRLSGFNAAALTEAALSHLSKAGTQGGERMRNARFAANFQAYSGHAMARLHGANGALSGVAAKIRLQLSQLQGKLMTQLPGQFGMPGRPGHMSGSFGRFNPGFQLPWGGRFSGPAFYHPSGQQMHWNGVDVHGSPMQTTMNLQNGKLLSQTPWSAPGQNGLKMCQTWDHGTGKAWTWAQDAAGISAAADQWTRGNDGVQHRNVFLYLPNKAPIRFSDTLDPASGKREIHSDWSAPDAQGRRSRISIDPQTRRASTQHHIPENARPSAGPEAGAGGAGQAPLSEQEKKSRKAYAAFGLPHDQPISEEQFAQVKKAYRKSALQTHPDKLKKAEGESDQAFDVRRVETTERFKELSGNFEIMQAAYDKSNGK